MAPAPAPAPRPVARGDMRWSIVDACDYYIYILHPSTQMHTIGKAAQYNNNATCVQPTLYSIE